MKRGLLKAFLLLPLLFSCARSEVYRESAYGFGTTWFVQYGQADKKLSVAKLVDLVSQYSSLCDPDARHEPNGVFALNQGEQIATSNAWFTGLLGSLEGYQTKTNGMFNPFLGKLKKAWLECLASGTVLDEQTIASFLEEANRTSLVFEGGLIKKIGDGLLDLGAIAKGYLVDTISNGLVELGLSSFYVDAGRSSLSLGRGFNNRPYQVYIHGTDWKFACENVAISTTGISEQRYEVLGNVYSHVIDAKTGDAKARYDSLTLVGRQGTKAADLDVYSTALFFAEPSVIDAYREAWGYEVVLIKDGEMLLNTIHAGK